MLACVCGNVGGCPSAGCRGTCFISRHPPRCYATQAHGQQVGPELFHRRAPTFQHSMGAVKATAAFRNSAGRQQRHGTSPSPLLHFHPLPWGGKFQASCTQFPSFYGSSASDRSVSTFGWPAAQPWYCRPVLPLRRRHPPPFAPAFLSVPVFYPFSLPLCLTGSICRSIPLSQFATPNLRLTNPRICDHPLPVDPPPPFARAMKRKTDL